MAEGGYRNIRFLDDDGYDEDGYDEDGYNKDGYDEDGYDKDEFDKYGYNKYGHDKNGKTFDKEEGESIPLFPRTSTSKVRERPLKPRVRTSTRKEVSFANPSFHVGDDGVEIEETSVGGIREGIPKLDFNYDLRKEIKKSFPNMVDSAVEVKMNNGRISVRLIGIGNEKWKPVIKKDGKPFIKFNKGIRKAMGLNIDEILNEKKNLRLEARERITKKKGYLDRVDISDEVRNTTLKEIEEDKEVEETLNQEIEEIEENIIEENEAIQNQSLKERIKEIFKKYGFTITSVVTAVGVVIGVIVSNLSSGLSNMAKGVGNGLKAIGKKLAEILPGMIGAIASFIFKTAGEVLGFLAENAWILVVAVVVYLVENLKKKNRR